MSDACSIIQRKLQPGEEILWCVRARPWAAARPSLFMIAFAVLIGAMIVLLSRADGGKADPKGFIGLCFCLCAIMSGIAGLLNCWFTIYAITNRRLIIEAPLARLHSLTADGISSISRSGSDARGTLMIAYKSSFQLAIEHAMGPKQRPRYFGLYGIQAPGKVETLIRETLLSRSPKITGEAA